MHESSLGFYFSQLLVEENNALKEILKGAVIVSDDGNMKDVCRNDAVY